MAVSIDNYLRFLSLSYYLKNDSDEVRKINTSLNGLLTNLNADLGLLIKRKFVFGSYDRDTILPRKFDSKSDIDVMVVFNHTEHERTPETYRAWLKLFADKYYKDRYGSEVVRSFPTVTIRLGHIHFDLKLTEANTKYNQIVRPIIRLLKAWNCNNGYPYDSYLLELQITGMNFFGDNIQSGFFYAVGQLNTSWGEPESKASKIQSFKYNIGEVKKALDNDDLIRAKHWLHRVLPST